MIERNMVDVPADGLGFNPVDGGWGWVVVFGAHISIGFAYSLPKVLSIFFKEIQEELGLGLSEISLISSIMLAATYGGGPLSSVLVNRFGSRTVVILGGLMSGLSMVAASFLSSIIFLYISIGIIGGCGLSLNLNASLTIISKYFLVKRPLANGLAMAGSPVFLCCLAPVNQYLLVKFGWRGSFLILGGLILNCCVAGALMRPVTQPCQPSPSESEKKVEEQPNNNTKINLSWIKNVVNFLDFSVFKDRGFIIYLIGNVMMIFGVYAPFVFLSSYAVSQGVDEYSAAFLLSIMGFVDMVIRPTTGLIASSKWIRPRIQYFFSFAVMLNGVCQLLCPLMKSYKFLVVYTMLFGMSYGIMFALIFECLMDLMGNQRFPSAFGLVTIIECFPVLLGPPTAGFLVDIFHDYKYLFFMCGSVIFFAGAFLFFMNIYHYHMLKKEENVTHSEQNQKDLEKQDQVEIKPVTEPVMAQAEPEAKEEVEPEGGSCPKEVELSKQN